MPKKRLSFVETAFTMWFAYKYLEYLLSSCCMSSFSWTALQITELHELGQLFLFKNRLKASKIR